MKTCFRPFTGLRVAALVAFSFLSVMTTPLAAAAAPVQLTWLEQPAAASAQSTSWGVPWPQGVVPVGTTFSLADASGNRLPVQTWPMAYWPDGSLKWSGFATVAPAGTTGALTLTPGATDAPAGNLRVTTQGNTVVIDTGALTAVIPFTGENLVESLRIGTTEVARAGKLVGILQHGPNHYPEDAPPRTAFASEVRTVTVEQSGPVRAVVKIEGVHQLAGSDREWLPFSVRLYFYTGETTVRMVHTVVFDGDQEQDFVRGLGVQFTVPMREQPHNRHVRFVGADGGLWAEPLQPGGGNAAQEAGQRFNPQGNFLNNAIWDDFKLMQPNPDGFTIVKRTNPQSTWIFAGAGTRASGFGFVGDLTGGLGVSVKDFWQAYPSTIEIRGASSPAAELITWLWAPEGLEMDMRHYATKAHTLAASYEDVQEGMSRAYGVARTSELTFYPVSEVPSRESTVALAEAGKHRTLLAASPAYLHSTGVFGVWSVVDRSTPFKRAIEDGLDSVLAFYQEQVDQQRWYGFWHYGDFMHSYSQQRHKWRYDWGGYAWANTELGTPLWMWYSYLRSGRADLFRLAEAHTRNTSETNVYHLGEMAGLGSRHNVVKWGDGAKEARASQSAHWRPFYYLTTDERTGDLMRFMAHHSLAAAARFDPMRVAAPQIPGEPQYAARIRIGPDWFAFAGNWMTEWERTGDIRWRDKIIAGVDSILAMPYWLRTGHLNGLNPDLPNGEIGPLRGGGAQLMAIDVDTGRLTPIRDPITKGYIPVSYNLSTIMGGAEVMFELVPLLGREDFAKAWLQYTRIGNAPAEVLDRDRVTGNEGADASLGLTGQSGPRLAAYSYAKTGNRAFAERAIQSMLNLGGGSVETRTLTGPDTLNVVEEALAMSTNDAAQTGLTTIQILELLKDALPNEAPARIGRAPRGGN